MKEVPQNWKKLKTILINTFLKFVESMLYKDQILFKDFHAGKYYRYEKRFGYIPKIKKWIFEIFLCHESKFQSIEHL